MKIFSFPKHDKETRKFNVAYNTQCALEHIVYLLVSDAFLAKLLKFTGMDDATVGILSSIISFSFLVQLIAIPLMRYMKNIKRTVIISDMASFLLYVFAYIVPFTGFTDNARHILLFLCIAGGAIGKYLTFNMYYRWANSYVNPERRGRFSAIKEMISLGAGIVVSLAIGFAVDKFEAAGNLTGGFILIACFMGGLTVLNFITLMMIKNIPAEETSEQKLSAKEVFQYTFRSKDFRNILLMQCLLDIATYMTTGFLGTYKTGELAMTLGTVQIINTCGYLGRMIFSVPIGIYSDRKSFAKGYLLGLFLCLGGFICLIFTNPGTKWLIIGFVLLYNIAQCGLSANSYNMMYSYVPAKCFVQAQAIKSSIGGLLGFLSSVAAGLILARVQADGSVIFGKTIYGQQLLALLSALLIIADIIFVLLVVSKQKVMKQ